jgi:hypothetical protein
MGAEMMLLGSAPRDSAIVEHDPNGADTGGFRLIAHVDAFQKRMRVRRRIRVEFVARGQFRQTLVISFPDFGPDRMWALTFYRDSDECGSSYKNEGAVVSLTLLENSPRTPFRGRLLIVGAKRNGREPSVPDITLVFTTTSSHKWLEPKLSYQQQPTGIVSKLDDVSGGASLQYE